jgi:MFS family permease
MARWFVDVPGFGRLWAASTVSSFGTYVTALALQVLAAVTLNASATQLGLLTAAQWLPYLLLGPFAGALMDRRRRRPVLVGADLGRAALLCVIPLLAFVDRLSLAVLIAVVSMFGVLSVFFDTAQQSFLPRMVPTGLLTMAYARLHQADATAQTTGPLLAGGLIRLVGAPAAVLVDAASYLVSGVLLATIRVVEPVPVVERRDLWAELREGASWVYRHRTLRPMALTGHLWFCASSVLSTVYVLYVLDGLGLSPFVLGLTYAFGGAGAVLGATLAGWVGRRFGVGCTKAGAFVLMAVVWMPVPLVGTAPAAIVVLAAAQFVSWVGLGAIAPNETAYRQEVTPDRLQGRMTATIRSLNRGDGHRVILAGATWCPAT